MKAHNEPSRKIFRRLALAAILLTSCFALAKKDEVKELCHGFLPENDMSIPVGFHSLTGAGLTEAQFNDVLDRAQQLYAPVISKAGGKLKINRLWSDATVNASAQQTGGTWILNMYGGLARHPATTVEGFALVVCHELGHHLGGAPKNKGIFGSNSWATNEGGSDYYAGLKCLREFFSTDDNSTLIDNAKKDGVLSLFASDLCEKQFAQTADQLLCKRTSLGGTSVAGLFQALRKEPAAPDYAKPDTKKVSKMFDAHPETQCRMDTYLAGAVCDVDKSVALSDTDYRQGSCVENVAKVGFRPRCWFMP